MITWPHIGLFGEFGKCEKGLIPALNENFFKLDILTQASFNGFVANESELPSDPTIGDVYINEENNNLYIWKETEWVTLESQEGWFAWIESENKFYYFDGSNWLQYGSEFVISSGEVDDNAVARWDGETGTLLQNSLVIIDDAGNVTGVEILTAEMVEATGVDADLVTTDLLSTKEIVGAVSSLGIPVNPLDPMDMPTTLFVNIPDPVTTISDILNKTTGPLDEIFFFTNKSSTDVTFINNSKIVTGTGSNLRLKPNASIAIKWSGADSKYYIIGGTGAGGSGGSGFKNYISEISTTNGDNLITPNFEDNNVEGWETYSIDVDTLTKLPDPSFGGPVKRTGYGLTIVPVVSKIAGKYSMEVDLSVLPVVGAAFAPSNPIFIDDADKGQVLEIEFKHLNTTPALQNELVFSGDKNSTFGFTIWAPEINQYVSVSNNFPFSVKDFVGNPVVRFQVPAGVTRLLPVWYVANTTSLYAQKAQVDDFRLGPQKGNARGAITTDMVDSGAATISATGGGFALGTIVRNKVFARHNGDLGHVKYELQRAVSTGFANGTGRTLFTLPNGMSFDSNRVVFNTDISNLRPQTVFGAKGYYYGGAWGELSIVPYDATRFMVIISAHGAASNAVEYLGSSYTLGSAVTALSLEFMFPLAGASSGMAIADSYVGRNLGFAATKTGGNNNGASGVISYTSATRNDALMFDLATGKAKIKTPGDYIFFVQCEWAASQAVGYYFAVNGTRYGSPNDSANYTANSIIIPDLKVDDEVNIISTTGSTVNLTTLLFSGYKLNGGSQSVAIPPTVAAAAWCSANKSATTTAPIDFDSIEFDTHQCITTGAGWRFTAKFSGLYEIEGYTWATVDNNDSIRVCVNGTAVKNIGYHGTNKGSSSLNGKLFLAAGQYIDIRPSANMTFTGGTLTTLGTTYITIQKVG